MPTKITVMYDNPSDPVAFEAGYPNQVELAKKLPGLRKIETSKVWPKEDGSPIPAYRMIDLYFNDYDAASAAVTTAEAGALVASITGLATGGVRIAFADVELSYLLLLRPLLASSAACECVSESGVRACSSHWRMCIWYKIGIRRARWSQGSECVSEPRSRMPLVSARNWPGDTGEP